MMIGGPRASWAQADSPIQQQRDSVSNGTAVGLGIGAAVGLFSSGPEGLRPCRMGFWSCSRDVVRSGTVGAAVGLTIDALRGPRIPRSAGIRFDDRIGTGAAIGAVAGVANGLHQARRCTI